MLTPEQGQILADLQSKMLANIAAGNPAHTGISKEELRKALAFVRQNRAGAVAAKAKAKAKTKAPSAAASNTFFDSFDLD